MDCGLPGSSVYGIFQARILEWAAMHSQGDLPNSGMEPGSLLSPALAGRFFTTSATWEALLKSAAPLSSTLAWKIPWMEEPGRLQSLGSLRVGHD